MDRILELLARLGSTENPLTPEEREELSTLIREEYARLDEAEATPEIVAAMAQVVDAAEALRADDARIEQEAQQAETDREALRQRMHVVETGEEPAGDGDAGEGDGGAGEGGDGDGAAEGDGEGGEGAAGDPGTPPATQGRTSPAAAAKAGGAAPAPAKAAASAGRASMGAISAARGRAPLGDRSPERQIPGRGNVGSTLALVAAADVRGFGIGQELPDWDAVGAAFAAKLNAMTRAPGAGGDKRRRRTGTELVLVASANWDYPSERLLVADDSEGNSAKLEAVVHPAALVASGGTCAPLPVDFDVPVWASTDRPLRDSLPAFGATRGGLRWVPAPTITGLAGATAVWTEANDANPTSPTTKPVLRITCGSETTEYVDAIPTRVEVGNFMGRFNPEWTGANMQLAMAAAARIAETNLQAKILTKSTVVTTGKLLGATRDILALLDQALVAYRYEQRIPRSLRLRALFPDWFKDMIRADIARELAHDIDDTDPFAVSDEMIAGWFNARGVSVGFFVDYLAAVTVSGVSIPNQYPAAFAAGSAVPEWPSNGGNAGMLWYLFAEGTFQFLDGGELDLGVVRDSVLDATNDYETFIETFEGIAFRGIRSLALVSYVRPNGGSAGSISTASY